MKFTVIDKKTGKYPDLWKIALKEDWAKTLCYCDMEGFAVEEDGTIVVMDECGKYEYPPEGRFEIVMEEPTTNYEKIQRMSVQELAEFFDRIDSIPCGKEFWEEWLNKEIKEGVEYNG